MREMDYKNKRNTSPDVKYQIQFVYANKGKHQFHLTLKCLVIKIYFIP